MLALFVSLQANASDEEVTGEDVLPFVAVLGPPLQPRDHHIVVENMVVVRGIEYFQDAVAMFLGLIYILNLKYNSQNTYDFMQKKLLKLDDKIYSKKALTLLNTLA